jgi:hypothetical protein
MLKSWSREPFSDESPKSLEASAVRPLDHQFVGRALLSMLLQTALTADFCNGVGKDELLVDALPSPFADFARGSPTDGLPDTSALDSPPILLGGCGSSEPPAD